VNSRAAEELLNLIMLDDFVQRRQTLDTWSRRWITTMHVEYTHDGTAPDAMVIPHAREVLLLKILDGLRADEVKVLLWGKLVGDDNTFACEMHCVMQEPRSLT